jgi:CheY-like chemotaxis protein
VVIVSVIDDPTRAYLLGATAYVVKPYARPDIIQALEAAALDATPAPAPAAQLPAPILVVEDNETSLTTVCDYLGASGYQTAVARNGTEAITQALELRPALILMDIQMPGIDGLEATRRIRANPVLAPIPIIALTALAMPGDRERCLAAGADDYLSKPVSLKELAGIVAHHLNGAHRRA